MTRVGNTRREVQERIDGARALTRSGYSARQIAVKLGVTVRTVVRLRNGQIQGLDANRGRGRGGGHPLSPAEWTRREQICLAHRPLGSASISKLTGEPARSMKQAIERLRERGEWGCCGTHGCPNSPMVTDRPCPWEIHEPATPIRVTCQESPTRRTQESLVARHRSQQGAERQAS